ncbi:predicted protein [Plenodomus lingam JN3]|uniref:Uncharacterized protein n=1 Tax=Leptosphaeria maculans (strain JN3 / isolate v23.1.3 / race Av1-4-5-6-7-8) TaxID=985895 RepID=E4ZFT7_LEPMJ|nr:predicted protein [Plenodomus lingam JN3]CBX90157.1 predicted protein [Plenodomus lingam JN3]
MTSLLIQLEYSVVDVYSIQNMQERSAIGKGQHEHSQHPQTICPPNKPFHHPNPLRAATRAQINIGQKLTQTRGKEQAYSPGITPAEPLPFPRVKPCTREQDFRSIRGTLIPAHCPLHNGFWGD